MGPSILLPWNLDQNQLRDATTFQEHGWLNDVPVITYSEFSSSLPLVQSTFLSPFFFFFFFFTSHWDSFVLFSLKIFLPIFWRLFSHRVCPNDRGTLGTFLKREQIKIGRVTRRYVEPFRSGAWLLKFSFEGASRLAQRANNINTNAYNSTLWLFTTLAVTQQHEILTEF